EGRARRKGTNKFLMIEHLVPKLRELLCREIQQRVTLEQAWVNAIRETHQWAKMKLELLRQAVRVRLRGGDRGRLNGDDKRVDYILKLVVVLHGAPNIRRAGWEQCAFVCAERQGQRGITDGYRGKSKRNPHRHNGPYAGGAYQSAQDASGF